MIMKKRKGIFQLILAMLLVVTMLAGLTACGKKKDSKEIATSENGSGTEEAPVDEAGTVTRVGSLKGPTTMGLVNLMVSNEEASCEGKYDFRIEAQPDALVSAFVAGEIDVALVPANLASVLYNKTEGQAEVLYINTLGVLYCVTGDDSIHSIKDLAGKTVLSTGQGATPEYALNYLLKENGVTDCKVEFKSEATEIAALLQENPKQIAILPQPFVTVAEMQNDQLKTVFSFVDEWDALNNGSKFLTGVTVVRKEFLEEHSIAVSAFLRDAGDSASRAVNDVPGTAALVVKYGIIEKDKVAEKAIPECSICFIDKDEMKSALSGYLQVLYDQDPKSVGGKLPADDFYYLGE